MVSWRSQQLKLYQWKVESGEGEKGEEGKEEEKTEKMKRGKCARSWKPLQGAVVAMAIDPTSTLLATGCIVIQTCCAEVHISPLIWYISRFEQWDKSVGLCQTLLYPQPAALWRASGSADLSPRPHPPHSVLLHRC